MKKPISKLHYITTSALLAEQACAGGADWIQLRLKNISYDDYKAEALKVQEVCKRYGATFIVNDSADLALDINADGVHIGKEDILAQWHIDALLARNSIIGCTTNTTGDVLHFKGKPVSYLGLGPFRFTATKQKLSPVLGLDGYKKIFEDLGTSGMSPIPPIVGIGGVLPEDVPALLETGLHGVAVSGAITNAADISAATRQFKNILSYEVQL